VEKVSGWTNKTTIYSSTHLAVKKKESKKILPYVKILTILKKNKKEEKKVQ
jgi:hypothetical protein